jgi:hypothetical protein
MSGTFPTANFTTMNWQSNNNIVTTETLTNKIYSKDIGGHYWSLTLKSIPLSRADFDSIWVFIIQQKGTFDTFYLKPPQINSTKGTFSNSSGTNLPVTSSGAVGATTVGVTPNGSGTLKAGDIIKFDNHDKVYTITADVNLSNTIANTIDIFPALITAITTNEKVITEDVTLKVRLQNDVQEFKTNVNNLYEYEIDVRESL